MPTVSRERLAEVFVEVADTLIDDFDLVEFLRTVTVRAAEPVNVAAVGLLLADTGGQLQFMAASDERTRLLELFQLQHREEPCLDCFTTGSPVVNADLRTATARWPVFAPHAAGLGFRSVHAICCGCVTRSSARSTFSATTPATWTPSPAPTTSTSARAFDLLRGYAHNHDRKLVDVAHPVLSDPVGVVPELTRRRGT